MKTENKVSIMKANEIIFYIKKSDTKKLQKNHLDFPCFPG